jgi:hypothetical protein
MVNESAESAILTGTVFLSPVADIANVANGDKNNYGGKLITLSLSPFKYNV